MLVRDLTFAGCVESVFLLPRPDLPHTLANSTGDAMHADGVLTVVQLGDCERPRVEYHVNPAIPVHPHSRMVRYFRDQVLLYKSDVVRGNVIFGTFDLLRMTIHFLRHPDVSPIEGDNLPFSPVSLETLQPQITLDCLDLSQ